MGHMLIVVEPAVVPREGMDVVPEAVVTRLVAAHRAAIPPAAVVIPLPRQIAAMTGSAQQVASSVLGSTQVTPAPLAIPAVGKLVPHAKFPDCFGWIVGNSRPTLSDWCLTGSFCGFTIRPGSGRPFTGCFSMNEPRASMRKDGYGRGALQRAIKRTQRSS